MNTDMIRFKCSMAPDDVLEVEFSSSDEFAFETCGDSVVVLSAEDAQRLVAWLQERLEK